MLFKTYNMNYKVYYFVLITLVGIVSYNAFPSVLAQTNNTSNIFTDSKSGISFHYPSDWRIASKEYANRLYGNPANANASITNIHISTITPIAIALPASLNGASFIVLSETLPFPVSVEKYFESTKNQLMSQGVPINKSTPVTISNLNGIKYNLTLPNGAYQTQVLFVKDSNGIVVAYIPGIKDHSKNIGDITSILGSLTFKTSNQNNTVKNTNIATTNDTMSNVNGSNSNSKNITTMSK